MQRSLIIVADRESALFFRHGFPGAPLEPVGEVQRASQGDRPADRPGRIFQSVNMARSSTEPTTSIQQAERQAMAAEIVARAHAALDADDVDRLVLIAEPKLLGELRQALRKSARERVVLELDRNLTKTDANTLARRLSNDGTLGRVREPSPRAANL